MLTIEKSLLEKVDTFLTFHSISETDGILVAFSGGADSLSLLYLLSCIHPISKLKALYVNHRLRSDDELDKEIEVNRRHCASLNIEFILIELQKNEVATIAHLRKNGIEEAARYIRYNKLNEFLKKTSFSYIATAHTKNDQDETLLMRMFQGSRMNFASPIKEKQGALIRPLIHITRVEIENYLTKKNLTWVEDSTNSTTLYLRNKIRHSLIPVVRETFPRWKEGLHRLNDEVEELNDYVEKVAGTWESQIVHYDAENEEVLINLTMLQNLEPIIIRRVLYRGYNLLPFENRLRLSHQSVEDIIRSILQYKGQYKRIALPDSTITFYNFQMKWKKGSEPLGAFYFSLVYSTHTHLHHSYYLCREEHVLAKVGDNEKVWIDDSVIVGPLVVRSYQEKDTIEFNDGTKSLTSLYASWHIEPSKRWEIPLLVDDKGVLAVLGRCFLGKDRVAKRAFLSPLARKLTTLYSVLIIKG